jgi:hypothetical protein
MVYINIDTGSRAKGYAFDTSDEDKKIYTKCDRETFLQYIDNKQLLKNKHVKNKKTGADEVHIDLYVGLIGILTGKSPDLGIFTNRHHVVDKYGRENEQLYTFIKSLTLVSMPNIVKTMMKMPVLQNDAKCMLRLMFNYTFVEYYLDYKKLPKSTKILNILFNTSDEVQFCRGANKYTIMVNNKYSLHLEENGNAPIVLTITDLGLHIKNNNRLILRVYCELMERPASCPPWIVEYFNVWREKLIKRIDHLPPSDERVDIRHNIVLYALNERGAPVMPEDKNRIVCQTYPSMSHLDRSKKGTLAGKQIVVQEKLDGCNFRVIALNDNTITYGSRNTYRPNDDFMKFSRIRAHLEECAVRLKSLIVATSDEFVVYGELMGWRDRAKTAPLNVIQYVDQEASLKFYAYDVQLKNGTFVPFKQAQIMLKSCGFDTVPYIEIKYDDFVNTLQFKSTLFPNSPLEGYVIRCDNLMYKLKENYKNLNLLKITTNTNDTIVSNIIKQFLEKKNIKTTTTTATTAATMFTNNKDSVIAIVEKCRVYCNIVSARDQRMLYNKIFNLLRTDLCLTNDDYKNIYKQIKWE